MKPFKGKFTENTFKLVNLLPFIFPKWLRETSKYYGKPETENSIHKKEDEIKLGSFLDGNFLWKAVSITVQLDHLELESLHRWMKKDASPSDYNPGRDSASFTVNYDRGGGYRSLGWVNVNTEKTITSLISIQHDSENCSSCYITLDMLSHGFSYVTIYMMLTEKANQKVYNVNTDTIERYKSFQSINPFSKRFKIIEHHDRSNLIDNLITKNFNKVVSECKDVSLSILKVWDIKKSATELISIADFYRDCSDSYFYSKDQKIESNENTENYQALISRYNSINDINISDDKNEHYCENRFNEDLDVHSYYILSKPESEFEDYNNYKRVGLTTNDSHLFFALIHDLYRQYNKVSDYINPVLLENRNVAEKNHTILHHALLKTDQLEDNIPSVESRLTFACDRKYHAAAKKHIEHIKKITTQLASAIKQRKEHSRDSLELRNIYFHKKYSYITT